MTAIGAFGVRNRQEPLIGAARSCVVGRIFEHERFRHDDLAAAGAQRVERARAEAASRGATPGQVFELEGVGRRDVGDAERAVAEELGDAGADIDALPSSPMTGSQA